MGTTSNTMNKESILQLREEIAQGVSQHTLDFLADVPSGYIDDAINEYADNNTSIYYCDQRKFYFDNTELCEDALCEYGYTGETLADLLKECGGLDGLICKAGAIGEYASICRDIWDDNNELRQLYAIDEILRYGVLLIDGDILDELLEDVTQHDDFDDIDEIVKQTLFKEE